MKPGPYVAAIDLGTTRIKVGIFDLAGSLLASTSREQSLLFPAAGRVEQDPHRTWTLQCEALREALARAEVAPERVEAVTLSVQRGTVIALDGSGEPLTNHIVWMDQRGVDRLEEARRAVGPERYYDTAGHPLVPYTGLSKVLWLQRDAPDLFSRSRVVGPPQTLYLRWLGADELLCDTSVATFFGPFDIRRMDWSDDLLAALALPREKLPRITPSVTIAGAVSQRAAEACGLRAGTRVIAGGGDGQCAGAGSGVTVPGRVMVNIGTAAGVQVFLAEPRLDPRRVLNCGAHVVTGAWEMEGHTQASGAVFRWVRDELARDQAQHAQGIESAYDRLAQEAAAVPPGAEGLLVLPTFNGASAPLIRPEFRGAILGLGLAHTRAHIIRAVLEGISLEIRWMLEAVREAGVEVSEVRLVGGGSLSPVWNQIHADVLGLPVTTLDVADAAVTGAAICAAVSMGAYRDFHAAAEVFARPRGRFEPTQRHAAFYEDLYGAYRHLVETLDQGGIFQRLGRVKPR